MLCQSSILSPSRRDAVLRLFLLNVMILHPPPRPQRGARHRMTKVILTLFFDEFPNLQIHSWEMWWFGRVCALKALPWIGSPLRFSRRGFMGPSFRRTFISAGLNGGMQVRMRATVLITA